MNPFPTTRHGILFRLTLSLLFLTGLEINLRAQAAISSTAFTYKLDFTELKKVGSELYENLKPKHQSQMSPNPIWFQEEEKPYVRPFQFQSQDQATRVVYVSEGFIWFAHYLAHAMAIDKIEPGFLEGYLVKLGDASEDKLLPELPQISAAKYWSEDIINEQLSYFNQIVAGVVAIEMAHHYLGHYDKYAEQLRDTLGTQATMASACSAAQWEAAMKLGAANALDCGYAFEGLKTVYDCIDKMPRRPRWTLYFLPAAVDVKKLKKELDKIEASFFGQK